MTFDKTKWTGNGMGIGMGGPKVHTYTTADTLATAAGSGYFNAIGGEMDTGDVVYINSTVTTGGGGKLYRMTKATNGNITLAALV